ncbi:MAG: type I-C CRISPR-associated protein Cas8c/Csd1, partial [Fimbriimonadaceae bacterium]
LNSPISPAAAEKIGNAVNHLLNAGSRVIDEATGKEKFVHRYSIRVGKVAYVAWSREEVEFDLWRLLDRPDPDQVRAMIAQPLKGNMPNSVSASDFYVLALSASAARVVVRDYHETTLDRVRQNIASWFHNLRLIGYDGQPARPPGIYPLAASLFRDANKEMPAHVPTALLAAAVAGRPLPEYLLGLAVKRNVAMQGPFREVNGNRTLSLERLALIKAILETKEKRNLSALDPQHPDAAYHCGRLLAVLEQIQRAALGEVNATIVDRYYGAACASPGTILGNLVNESQAHLSKMRKSTGDGWAQNRLQDVLSAIGTEFPKTLSLHRQGLFALGYYHQKAHDKAAAIEAKAAKQSETENPSA